MKSIWCMPNLSAWPGSFRSCSSCFRCCRSKPATTAEAAEAGTYLPEHICEPSPDSLLGEMLPRNVYVQIYSALLETSTSEHAARMMAMDNATKACNDMIENLTLVYNKARQAAITAELMDIVGGAEALKG